MADNLRILKTKKNNALLVIDIQERIIKPIKNIDGILININLIINAYKILGDNIYFSEQNPSKLGSTNKNLLPNSKFKVFEKMAFSLGNDELINRELNIKRVKDLIICGVETHICIQQTVIDFLKKGFNIYIVADAMGSRNIIDHNISIQRMISMGVNISSTESIIFELCKTASRDEFKEISNLIKNK